MKDFICGILDSNSSEFFNRGKTSTGVPLKGFMKYNEGMTSTGSEK